MMYSGNHKLESAQLAQAKRKIEDTQSTQSEPKTRSNSESSLASPQKVLCTASSGSTKSSEEGNFSLRRLLKDAISAARLKTSHSWAGSEIGCSSDSQLAASAAGLEQANTIQLFDMLFKEDYEMMNLQDSNHAILAPGLGWPSDRRVSQVLRTITSNKLSEEIAAFLYDCTNGPVGSTLCECLRGMGDPMNNPFFVDFAKSLFCRFQRVISRRVEADLFDNGLLSHSQLSASAKEASSTAGGLQGQDDSSQLVFESQGNKALSRFLDLLKIYSALPNLDNLLYADGPLNPFSLVNKTWRDVSQGNLTWFTQVMHKEFGLVDPYLGFILGKANYMRKMYATPNRFISIGSPVLTFTGHLDMIADNHVRLLNQQAPPLFEYLEMIKRMYVYRHQVSSEGFMQQFCFISAPPNAPTIKLVYTQGIVQSRSVNELHMTRKLVIVPRLEFQVPEVGEDARDLLDRVRAHPQTLFTASSFGRELQFVWVCENQ